MKTYTVILAEDIPHYGMVEIEAADDDAAIAAARALDPTDIVNDPDWTSPVCKRIVCIEDGGEIVAHDLPLDDFHVRNGGDEDRRLCEAAPQLLAALKRIAAIPLWGEPIPPGDVRDSYAEHAEYDLGEDSFEPSCDTESTLLSDAVEEARSALAALEGRGS